MCIILKQQNIAWIDVYSEDQVIVATCFLSTASYIYYI